MSDDDDSSVTDLDITKSITHYTITIKIFVLYTKNVLSLTFPPYTIVTNLNCFAEQGCIAPLLSQLSTLRLKTLGYRMLADHVKMPNLRVAVASNNKNLDLT